MFAYYLFLISSFLFLIGIFLASINFSFIFLLLIFLVFSLVFFFYFFYYKNKNWLFLFLSLWFLIFGFLYYKWDDFNFWRNQEIVFNRKIKLTGVVVNNPKVGLEKQEFYLELKKPLKGRILVRTFNYSEIKYGDLLFLEGEIKKPESGFYRNYLMKERVSGIVYFPLKLEVIEHHQGSFLKEKLFDLRNSMLKTFKNFLSVKEAALLSGLTLGDQSWFSSDFKRKMNLSGTTHIVALSGYNVTLVAWLVNIIFLSFFSKKISFFLTVLMIIVFVIMTGAEASVLRAGIMGLIIIWVREGGLFYNLKSAILIAAILMIIINPKFLVFDVGFQLSFLALLGIVYLKPAVVKFFKFSESPGFLGWRENFLTTLAAQLMVLPILVSYFNNFSLTSLLANVLILEVVPLSMFLGFLMNLTNIFSYYLTLIFSWFAWVLLKFQVLVIELFSEFYLPLNFHFSFLLAVFYYLFLFIFINFNLNRTILKSNLNQFLSYFKSRLV